MLRKVAASFAFVLAITVSIAQPVITSFNPSTAPVGATVTINGTNFNPVAANNIVSFGTARASVISANTTQLTVTVPAAATFDRITVRNTGLPDTYIVQSTQPFLPTWSGQGAIDSNSFKEKQTLISAFSNVTYNHIYNEDLDGDNKIDLVVTEPGILNILRNTSQQELASFAPKQTINMAANFEITDLILKDISGDGKPDLIILGAIGGNYSSVLIFLNNSVVGNISFSSYYNIPTNLYDGRKIFLSDVDGNGKPEIITFHRHIRQLAIWRNISGLGVYAFANIPSILSVTGEVVDLKMGDLDGDGKDDIALSNFQEPSLLIFRNISVDGEFLFANAHNINSGPNNGNLMLMDLNNDQFPEIILLNRNWGQIITYKNISTPGEVNFTPTDIYSPPGAGRLDYIISHDFDGDGIADIAAREGYYINVVKNRSLGQSILLGNSQRYFFGFDQVGRRLSAGDFNGDGKPEIATLAKEITSTNVILHENDVPFAIIGCPGNSIVINNPVAGSSYIWQVNTPSGFVDLANDATYSGVTTSSLQILNIPASFYGNEYRCVVDGISKRSNSIIFRNEWTGAVDQAWENPANWSCGSAPNANTDVVVKTGTILINSNVTVRSLTVQPGASITVAPGFTLTITH